MSQLIDLSNLPAPIVEAIQNMVRTYREHPAPSSTSRPIGWARGILPELPPSFFEPLPQEFLDLFEDKRF